MPAPVLTEDDFLALLQNLLPQGRAWPRDDDATLTLVLRGIAKAQAEAHQRQIEALTDEFPVNTIELLPEWEASLGLPDPCAGTGALVDERRAQVVARLKNSGGQSVAYFIQFALDLGFAITVTEFTPSRFGRAFGQPFGGEAWAHTWQVNAPQFTVRYFSFGADVFGTPFADWDGDVLICELQRIKPAQTTLLFAFS
jgi:uncharacterized protein YmfQ (DUF2313 family)